MPLDAAALTSSIVADLAREFPWATPQQLAQAEEASLSVFADARVQTFLPILARREAQRALKALLPATAPAAMVVQTTAALIDLTGAPSAVVSHG